MMLLVWIVIRCALTRDPRIILAIPKGSSPGTHSHTVSRLVAGLSRNRLPATLISNFDTSRLIRIRPPTPSPATRRRRRRIMRTVRILGRLTALGIGIRRSHSRTLGIQTLMSLLFDSSPVARRRLNRLGSKFGILGAFTRDGLHFHRTHDRTRSTHRILSTTLKGL